MKKIKRLGIGILVLSILLLSACSSKPDSGTEPTNSNAPFRSFTAVDLQGNQVDQSIFQGHKLTMINIWGTFCGPCIREMPDLGKINTEYKDKGFQIVGIVIDATDVKGIADADMVALAKEIVDQTGASYTHLIPSKGLIDARLNSVTGVPETIFVDEAGNPVGASSYSGAKTIEKWKSIIDDLLKEVD